MWEGGREGESDMPMIIVPLVDSCYTSMKIEVHAGCRDDTMPKTEKALRGGLRACNKPLQPNLYILVLGGCGRLCRLVSLVHKC